MRVEECSAALLHIEQVQCLVCLLGLRLTTTKLITHEPRLNPRTPELRVSRSSKVVVAAISLQGYKKGDAFL
jgi:hypothetical protein